MAFILESPDEARDILKAFFPTTDDDVFAKVWEIEMNPQGGPVYLTATNPIVTPADLEKVIAFKKLEGVDPAAIIDTSILEKVLAEEG